MSSSEVLGEIDTTPDMLDRLIKKIALLQVELIRNRQIIHKLKEDKENHLLELKELQKELGALEDVITTKNQELEISTKECESLKEMLSLTLNEKAKKIDLVKHWNVT